MWGYGRGKACPRSRYVMWCCVALFLQPVVGGEGRRGVVGPESELARAAEVEHGARPLEEEVGDLGEGHGCKPSCNKSRSISLSLIHILDPSLDLKWRRRGREEEEEEKGKGEWCAPSTTAVVRTLIYHCVWM